MGYKVSELETSMLNDRIIDQVLFEGLADDGGKADWILVLGSNKASQYRMPKAVEEFLYPAMEDFAVDFVFDKGVHARSHRYRLKRFTLVGATTRVGLLSAPLRGPIIPRLPPIPRKLARTGKRLKSSLILSTSTEWGSREFPSPSRWTPARTKAA